MNKANECTCPSGDGSLVHPCPAHPAVEQACWDERKLSDLGNELHNLSCSIVHENEKLAEQIGGIARELWNWPQACAALAQPSPAHPAPVEQAGGDERDFQAKGAQEVPSPVSKEYDRHLIGLLRKGEALPGHQEEAADEIERLRDWNDHLNNTVLPNILNPNFLMLMKGGERLLDLCTKDGEFIGVSLNDMKDVFDWMVTHARIAPDQAALAQPSPKCATCGGTGMVDDGEITCSEGGIPYENGPVKCVKDCPDCKAQPSPAQAEKAEVERPEVVAWQYRVTAGPQTGWSLWHPGKGEEFERSYTVERRPLMTVAQHERIVAALARPAQTEQQPVAWVEVKDRHEGPYEFHGIELLDSGKHNLYAAPIAQTAKGGEVMSTQALTHEQKLQALAHRFYQGSAWQPKVGDYYTTSRADLELYRVMNVEGGKIYTEYCTRPGELTEWDADTFTTHGFGPRRVHVPDFILASTIAQTVPQPVAYFKASSPTPVRTRVEFCAHEKWMTDEDTGANCMLDGGWSALYAAPIAQTAPQGKFRMGDIVKKSTGSEWEGRVVGWYSTEQTPEGYAVESSAHRNSVQIYPAKALEAVE